MVFTFSETAHHLFDILTLLDTHPCCTNVPRDAFLAPICLLFLGLNGILCNRLLLLFTDKKNVEFFKNLKCFSGK